MLVRNATLSPHPSHRGLKSGEIIKENYTSNLKSQSALDPSRIGLLWSMYMAQWFLSCHVLIP